jgi:hypothetical protein
VSLSIVLVNPETNYRVSTTEVRMHSNTLYFYACCSNGYVYLFDRLSRRIKYHSRSNPCQVLDILLIKGDSELIALYKNGNIAVMSSLHL